MHEVRQVVDPQHCIEIAEVLKELQPFWPLLHRPMLRLGKAEGDEFDWIADLVQGGYCRVTGTCECPGTVDDIAQHCAGFQARADAQVGLDPLRNSLAQ